MSLTAEVFDAQMSRLILTFGIENFPKPRVEEIFVECSDLTDDEFKRIATRMIQDVPVKRPPTVSLFREFAETYRKERRDRAALASHPDRRQDPPAALTPDDAIAAVEKLFLDVVGTESFPEEFKKWSAFAAEAEKFNADLCQKVRTLKNLVKAGGTDFCGEYVESARFLIIRTAVKIALSHAIKPVYTPPPPKKEVM